MNIKSNISAIRHLVVSVAAAGMLTACSAQVDRHGHVFTDVDLQQVQPGMSKDQVKLALGTPDTTATVGGDVYYYISSTRKTSPFREGRVVDRKVVVVYFDQSQMVAKMGNYGLKDGRVFDFISKETPSHGRELTALQQIFGNIANRSEVISPQ